MTDGRDHNRSDEVDSAVSAEYQRLAGDTAPDALNRSILKAAHQAVAKRQLTAWQVTWFRPLATLAVMGLSLGIWLEFNELENSGAPVNGSEIVLPAGDPADVFREAAENSAQQIRAAETAASRAAQNAIAEGQSTPGIEANTDQESQLSPERGCTDDQRASMAGWWRCIELLENGGATALAEQELAALLRTYPAFVEPGQ